MEHFCGIYLRIIKYPIMEINALKLEFEEAASSWNLHTNWNLY